jgi:hypothetical protein
MFEGGFKEGQQLKAILDDIEGVVSVQSLEAFLQWLYLSKIAFDLNEPEKQISALIELARFADMCGITKLESHIAQYFKRILVTNPRPRSVDPKPYTGGNAKIINTYCLTTQHIISATFLPQGHKVRRILAAAIVEQSLLCENDELFQETREYPAFGADLLEAIRKTLKGLKIGYSDLTYQDPLDGSEKRLSKFLGYSYSK